VAGEVLMFAFMVFAISRLTFSKDTVTSGNGRLDRDPEFRVALFIVIGVALLLFLRHWVATFEIGTTDSLGQSLRAFWGGMFTVLSFMTTTGFESSEWDTSQDWSGLGTPELILMGLALIGGGVATTAGGVKLLRVYALYLSGLREMERLVHPSSVSGAAAGNRRIQKDGAFIAWIFFMLFALSIALISVTLAALGSSFEDAIVLTIAALSTTGPLVGMVTDGPLLLIELSAATKLVLCGAMVLGRLETLAIIALLTPALWRR
jgi:trk system potassium uptake protein TrkH